MNIYCMRYEYLQEKGGKYALFAIFLWLYEYKCIILQPF